MQIEELLWPNDRVEHIARHGVEPGEVEEVCFGICLVLRARSGGENPVYYVLGETAAGRHLFCVVIRFPGGRGYPVTAREMTAKEKPLSRLEETMKPAIPQTDSIEELARFWQSHDVTDFDEELEEVEAPTFRRRMEEIVPVPLTPVERKAVREIAESKGIEETALIHQWVREKLPQPQ